MEVVSVGLVDSTVTLVDGSSIVVVGYNAVGFIVVGWSDVISTVVVSSMVVCIVLAVAKNKLILIIISHNNFTKYFYYQAFLSFDYLIYMYNWNR